MAVLEWDKTGERIFQTGVDHGVLYLHDGKSVVWNGLTGIDEQENAELKSFYLDGVKYLDTLLPGDFSGKLKAFTYPEEFDSVNGTPEVSEGLNYYNQQSKSFDLSYRTLIGNDVDGTEHGYKIHILYNLIAKPEDFSFATLADSAVAATEFSWSITGTPPPVVDRRPTVHISIDSTKTPPEILDMLEDILYGTDVSNPSLPSLEDISEIFGYLGALIIVDHGDGTWSAIDESDSYVIMVDDTTFRIESADATYLDAVTYTISSTNVHE